LKTRIVTGLIFGIVLIGSIFLSSYSFLLLLLAILLIGLHEYLRLVKAIEIAPAIVPTYLLNLSALASFVLVPVAWQAGVMGLHEWYLGAGVFSALILSLLVGEVFRAKSKPFENVAAAIFSLFYLAIPLGLLLGSTIDEQGEYSPVQALFFFLFMWASDTGAYFTGMFFGRHKLLERLSPKKTIEGFIGGIVFSMLTGWAAFHFIGNHSAPVWICGGAVLSCTGALGDLFESMLKRQAGVKDSGNILPGHGGVLDRFDSTFLAAPVYFFLIHAL